MFEENRDGEAFNQWQLVIHRYPYTSNWGAALYNCGWVHQKRRRLEEAIPFYEQLLNSDLDDRDPNPDLMSPYRNYHHSACLGLSECHEDLGNLEEALRYARLAQDTYPYQTWCLTCAWGARQELKERIERLEEKVNGQ